MKFKGGYNISLGGKPVGEVVAMPHPEVLYLPLQSRRFVFGEICVEDGQRVNEGDVLAIDVNNYSVGLLAPRESTVRLNQVEGYIVLEDAARTVKHQEVKSEGTKQEKLLNLGAWQWFYDAYSGELPNPFSSPQAIIVSTVSLEPFSARGDVQIKDNLSNFTRGLEQLQSFLEYQPIYLVVPDIKSELSKQIGEQVRGHAWVKMVEVPLRYGCDNFAVLARRLGLKRSEGSIWAVRAEGVLAVDQVLTLSRPCISRMISVGGPAVSTPVHIEIMAGYPMQLIKDGFGLSSAVRIVNGGVFTGELVGTEIKGIDTECRGLTILPEHEEREFLGFVRPGWDRRSYSGCFLSSLRGEFGERLTTAMRGEERACISCNFCEEVCPAGIIPYLIHKYLYGDQLEEAEEIRIDLCVECGLCSFVCPSKIELMKEFIEAKDLIAKEKEEIRCEQEKK